jgi:mannose-1-phosphate guanylyltransferase
MQNQYIVIMAGGSGTRLWPLSRKRTPKQFQSFLSDRTLLQETYDRALLVVPASQIYISTTEAYLETVKDQLGIHEDHLILEPIARNTAPAIALVASTIARINPHAIVATIASDHAIENDDEFVTTLKTAFQAIETYPSKLATVGINPTKPDTGLGYIKIGNECPLESQKRVFFIDEFKEKPDYETALRYTEDWGYLWNAGYFIFSVETFAKWLEIYSSILSKATKEIQLLNRELVNYQDELLRLYSEAPSEPIEPLIVEKLSPEERLVIPSSLQWSDVGNWSTLLQFLTEKKNTSVITEGPHLDLGSENILIKNTAKDKKIVTLGLRDIVIIDTPDAILIADSTKAGTDMKALIEKLKSSDAELL